MKTLIFSDSHLTHKFDGELFDYISNLIKGVDQVIINGDFWDAYLTTFNKFTKSKWNKLFPLLKKKNAIYIFGNHDKKKFMDDRYNLFSIKQVEYLEFKSGKRDFYITHGHLIAPTYDNIFFFRNPVYTRFFYKMLIFMLGRVIVFGKMFNFFEQKRKIRQLKSMKTFTNGNGLDGQFFIFGHSHLPVIKISEHFISLGPLQKKQRSYCLIDEGYIDLIRK